ncbi:MAG: hypothetical protein P4L82_14925 [Ancalomicrobiaceae bacterium]|nr:hypothetical protein [Ancalomicrobiaceae bacterium]
MYNPTLIDPPDVGAAAIEAKQHVVLGMPHLSGTGLSEHWLLKELGHVHWQLIAQAAGRIQPDFRDDRGDPVYAAFCALSVRDGDFGAARENDCLTVRSRLDRLSRTQFASRHELTIDRRRIGVVELISTFVRRDGDRASNHTIARYAVAGLPRIAPDGVGADLAGTAAEHRAQRLVEHLGFAIDMPPVASFRFSPCPSTDFNGAGFLYFASFAAFADRAEWAHRRAQGLTAVMLTTVRRDIFFTGNLDPGEDLVVRIMAETTLGGGMTGHHMAIVSEPRGLSLARLFTLRQEGRSNNFGAPLQRDAVALIT